jgi:Ca2+/H+ antiporter, TMEM165/GDT1 family
VLIGATLAMLVADGLGIIIGVVLCKHIPQRIIKWFSAVIFVVFGLVGVYEVLNAKTGLLNTAFILLVLSIVSALAMLIFAKTKKPLTNDLDKRLCREKTIVKTYSLFLKI